MKLGIIQKLESLVFMLAVIGLGMTAYLKDNPSSNPFLEKSCVTVTIFDVGQGDSALIETKDGKQMLIDGGPDASVLDGLNRAMPIWDKLIDTILVSHPHFDHINGLLYVLRQYDVGEIIMTNNSGASYVFGAIKEEVQKKNIKTFVPTSPQEFNFGDAVIDIVPPSEDANDSLNENSIILKVSCGENSVLFTGDSGTKREDQIIESSFNLESEVLRVGHHGSKSSTSQEFLNETDPEFAIISVGINSYGHPHPSIINRLINSGAKIYRTDNNGDIVVKIEKDKIEVASSNAN